MRRNIYERFYGQGTGGYTREHQIYGGSRQSSREEQKTSEDSVVVAFPQEESENVKSEVYHTEEVQDNAPAITIDDYNEKASSAKEEEMDEDLEVIAPALSERTDRIENIAGDPLLAQIDEFRQRAEQINAMLIGRQKEAESLGELAMERANRVSELDADIVRKKAAADEVMSTVGRHMKVMDDKITDRIEDMNHRIDGRMDDMGSRLDDGFGFVTKKLEGQMENFRTEIAGQMQKTSDDTMAQIDEIKENLGAGISEDITSIKNSVDGMREKIEDKVHTESVASYRNTVDAIKSIDHYADYKHYAEDLEKKLENMKGNVRFLSIFSIINFLLLTVVSLYFMGFFKLF